MEEEKSNVYGTKAREWLMRALRVLVVLLASQEVITPIVQAQPQLSFLQTILPVMAILAGKLTRDSLEAKIPDHPIAQAIQKYMPF